MGCVVGCSHATPAPSPMVVQPERVPTEVAPAESIVTEAQSSGHPRVFELLESEVAGSFTGARLLRVDDDFDDGRAVVEGPGFTLSVRYYANEERDRASFRDDEAFHAVRFLRELAAAGVDLEATGQRLATRDGPLLCERDWETDREFRCWVSAEPELEQATLEHPRLLVRPSLREPAPPLPQRSQPGGTRVDPPRLLEVLARHVRLQVVGHRLAADRHALLVTVHDGAGIGAALCIASGNMLRCASTTVERLGGIVADGPDHWLLTGYSSFGNHRSGESLLIAIGLDGEAANVDILAVGGVSGFGGGCVAHSGYCVEFDAWVTTPRLVAEQCLERRHEEGWSATHVRVGDLWIDEVVRPREGGPCVERFSFGVNGFERSECGPPPETPSCASEEPFVREPFVRD